MRSEFDECFRKNYLPNGWVAFFFVTHELPEGGEKGELNPFGLRSVSKY